MNSSRQYKAYTGEEKTRYALILGDRRINFYHNSGFLEHNCDKIITEYDLSCEGLFSLPVSLIKETCRDYKAVLYDIDKSVEIERLSQKLTALLKEEIGEDGEIISMKFSASEDNGLLYVTLRSECIEQIADIREMTDAELRQIETENYAREEEKPE